MNQIEEEVLSIFQKNRDETCKNTNHVSNDVGAAGLLSLALFFLNTGNVPKALETLEVGTASFPKHALLWLQRLHLLEIFKDKGPFHTPNEHIPY